MRSSIAVAVCAAVMAHAAVVPELSIEQMKSNIMKRQVANRGLAKRQSVTTGVSDADVLNFALTLEHLEATFYSQAIAKFNESAFASAGFSGAYAELQQIGNDESQHVSFLTSALTAAGATPVSACTYTFPYTDVPSFLAVSQILEGVGVSAYLGAAGSINNTDYLTAAGSILTVEARHNAFIRYLNGYSPFPSPEDTPQSATAVVTMASGFFASCPSGSAPSIKPFPALTVNTSAPATGQMLNIAPTNASAVTLSGTVYCGFASGIGAAFSNYNNGACMVPTANITGGQIYVTLTKAQSVSDASVLAGPAIINLDTKNVTVSGGSSTATASGASSLSSSGGAAKSSASTLVPALGAVTVLSAVFALFAGVA